MSNTIAEDDHLRSRHVFELLREPVQTIPPSESANIPKVIVQFWHDLGSLPSDVCECLDSWQPLTGQGFQRILFDDNEASLFIATQFGGPYSAAYDRCRHPAMRCDYFRLCYIFRNGGFYVDADEVFLGGDCHDLFYDARLKVQPLCYNSQAGTMIGTDTFMQSQQYSADWTYYVNNNPLIAPASHPVVRLALERSTHALLHHTGARVDIQSTTGPGNFTASLVKHSINSKLVGKKQDFVFLTDWEGISISRWPLSYRDDERNWRLWNPAD
jgi:mannosyltransferase OCH1-like enzyme